MCLYVYVVSVRLCLLCVACMYVFSAVSVFVIVWLCVRLADCKHECLRICMHLCVCVIKPVFPLHLDMPLFRTRQSKSVSPKEEIVGAVQMCLGVNCILQKLHVANNKLPGPRLLEEHLVSAS